MSYDTQNDLISAVHDLRRGFDANIEKIQRDVAERDERIGHELNRLEARMNKPNIPSFSTGGSNSTLAEVAKALNDGRADLARYGQLSFEVNGSISKATLPSTLATPVSGQILDSARVGVPFELRGMLPSMQVGKQVWSVTETALTTNVVQQSSEGDSFGESLVTIGATTLPMVTFGSYVTVSEQCMEDFDSLIEYLSRVLSFGLNAKIEAYILAGLRSSAAATNTSAYWSTVDNQLDEISAAAAQLAATGYYPTLAVVNPQKFYEFATTKSNSAGTYVYGEPAGQRPKAAFGVPIVAAASQTASNYSVIDGSKCIVYERAGTRIEAGRINDDYTKALVRIRAVERLAFVKSVGGAVMSGAFTL